MKNLEDLLEGADELEIEDFVMDVDEIELEMFPQLVLGKARELKATSRVERFSFKKPVDEYISEVMEVSIGPRSSSKKKITIGGSNMPALCFFEGDMPNKPVVAHDLFDMALSLPSSVKQYFEGVLDDPAEWAKKQVNDFNAEIITLHLISTDPNWRDTSAKDAAKTVEDVLQAVDVPLIISGSGNLDKDPEILEKVAEVCEGENVLLSAVNPMMDYARVVKAAVKYDHLVLSLVSMDPAGMKQMNRNIMKEGLSRERIIMDPVTGALGYGIEYSISTMERIRWTALMGDKDLSMPILSGTSNSWSAREAWLEERNWGPKEFRGPLWEAVTGTMTLLSGADIFMMLHPGAMKALKNLINSLFNESGEKAPAYREWINMEVK